MKRSPVAGTNGLRTLFAIMCVVWFVFGAMGRGQAQPNFFPNPQYAVGSPPKAIAVGDLNGDGKLDFVTVNEGVYNVTTHTSESTITVRLGNGFGGFGAKTDYALNVYALSVALGDVNGDGKLDLVIGTQGNYDSGTGKATGIVVVLMGNGTGGFGAGQSYAIPSWPLSVALGDVNGDGKLDLIFGSVGPYNDTTESYDSSVSVYLNDGAGGFGANTDYTIGSTPASIALADANGDGRPDIITANYNFPGKVSVLLSNGAGGFGTSTEYAVGGQPLKVVLKDINGDGQLDIITANRGSNTVTVRLGDGSGGFNARSDYGISSAPATVVVGDVNGDGRLDLVTATPYNGSSTSVLLQSATPVASASGKVTLDGLSASAPAQDATFTFRPTVGGAETTLTGQIAANGSFVVGFLPAVPGTLHVKGRKYLASNFMLDLSGGDVTNLTGTLLVGDADNNNVVNSGDFGLLVNAYGSAASDGSGYYNPNADFNGDGAMDSGDFGLLVNNYGRVGEP